MELNDKLAKDILIDRTDFKLSIAKNLLEKIDIFIPHTENAKDFHLEFCAEGFLLFANGVIEILTDEINEKFQIFQRVDFQVEYVSYETSLDEESQRWLHTMNIGGSKDKFYPKFNIYNLRDNLDLQNADQKKVHDLISKYFEYPKKIGTNWDFSNSSLWQLRELRNHVSHQRALNRNYVIGTTRAVQYIFRFRPDPNKNFEVTRVVNVPKNYFSELYKDLVDFREGIRNIIPYSMPSSQYKNQLDFGLQF